MGFVMGVFSIKVSVCGKDKGKTAIARGQTHRVNKLRINLIDLI